MGGAGGRSWLVAVMAVAALLPTMGTAAADPVVPTPSSSPAAPTTPAKATTPDPELPAGPSVLIVHVAAPAAKVGAAITATVQRIERATPGADVRVRHRFTSQQSFSIAVDPAHRAAAITELRQVPAVTDVEPTVTRHFFDTTPDDPGYAKQAGYLQAVNAPTAWQTQHGSPTVRIAVIDSGVDVTNPDLKNKVVATYNAHSGGTDITDDVGHGTFVAGVAAAQTDNGIGVAGAGYNTSILGVKIAGPDGSLSIDDEIAGIRWAVANGAQIINLSLGGTESSAAERSAVEDAIAHGVLVVAAAGNAGTTQLQYPAAYPGVVAVGATDTSTGKRAQFSSYGPWVTLAAPGVGIYSTAPVAGSEDFGPGGYGSGDGTSFSAPIVAGEAALLEAQSPRISESALRHALVASSHGYGSAGLGAGQVDFALALGHLPPTDAPSAVSVAGTSNQVTLDATSDAPTVEFRVDGGAASAPVSVSGGTASMPYPSWGLPNGTHVVSAVNCSAHGECGSSATTGSFTLANDAPTLLSPAAGATSTGRFTVTAQHPGGGGAELLVDDTPDAFAAQSPYAFVVNGSQLADKAHTLSVALCSPSGALCKGPASPDRTISTQSLHPAALALSARSISPNGDGVLDTAQLGFTLPDAEWVRVETLNTAGDETSSSALRTLAAGRHTWTWRGLQDDGTPLPDGKYTLAVVTTATVYGQRRDGFAGISATVDTKAPTMSGTQRRGVTFYPVRDGYEDTFTPSTVLSGAGELSLVVRNARGQLIRTVSGGERAAGRQAITWSGYDSAGHLAAPGRYMWQFDAQDAAGNIGRTSEHAVEVSGKRLASAVSYVSHYGWGYDYDGGTARCASARTSTSLFPRGLRLTNGCAAVSGNLAYAAYTFRLPDAIAYHGVTIETYGYSDHLPSELAVALQRNDGVVEIPSYVKVDQAGHHWHSIGSATGSTVVTRYHHLYASVLLDSTYAGANDFDLRYVRVRVTRTVLR